MRTATTSGFITMAIDSIGREACPSDEIMENVENNSLHLCALQIAHNDCDLRSYWLVRLLTRKEPVPVLMDTSVEVFNANTSEMSPPVNAAEVTQ